MPTIVELFDLAARYHQDGDPRHAERLYRQIISTFEQAPANDPNHANVYYNLGNTLKDQGKTAEAVEFFRQALAVNPLHADAFNNLGTVLFTQGEFADAVRCFHQALRINPNHADAYCNLGYTCKEQGQLDEALACFRKTLELQPQHSAAHSDLIFTLHFQPDQDAAAILKECRRWNECHARPLAKFMSPHANDKSPDRRLRVGYVSPDLRAHPVGRFLLPLLEAHDHGQFEIFCYSGVNVPDKITERCRRHADAWRPIFAATDEQVAEQVRQDRIDILVDLAMHTGNNRLLVFARKPAPVQVTYLAYGGTTGLDTMDYRLTDPYVDPPGQNDSFYSEESIRLPNTYWCYQPVPDAPTLAPLPNLQTGHITFGCLNNFCKVTAPTLEAWCHLLQAMPTAHLILNSPLGSHRRQVQDVFARHNIASDRLIFVDRMPLAEYFRTYQRIDVALDPFPFGGGTTTCDALWMGVPVVSLAGHMAVSRGGVSILSNAGLPELIASSADDYVRIAVALARDVPRLSALRRTLRERMAKSPLMDALGFTRAVEQVYRQMWRRWCA